MANMVAIVGRPNVGKSTLFNRLVEQRDAITDDVSGVTRDRHYGIAEWSGKKFSVIDTGGYVVNSDDVFEEAIREQINIALDESNAVLFLVDSEVGITGYDKDIAQVLRSSKKPVYLVANKSDNYQRQLQSSEFYALGLGEVYPIAAINGSGTGELLDDLIQHITEEGSEQENELPKFAVIGRPNVGKSSLVNMLMGQNRSIVTDIAGTTRDAVDAHYNLYGKEFILTDTAGLRRKSRVKENIEFYSTMRSIKALYDSDVCIVMIDATQGVESQDISIMQLAQKNKKGIVLVVNKWDLIEKETNTAIDFKNEIINKIAPLDYIPIIFTSVTQKKRIFKILEKAISVYENRKKKIPTSKLNEYLLPEIEHYPPPAVKGKYIKIKYITQLASTSPAFAFFCNHPKLIKQPYTRFIENKIRKHFDFEGVPVRVFYREK